MLLKKPLIKPLKLHLLELLDKRMDLPQDHKLYYWRLKKGYEGEVRFNSLTETLSCDCYIFNGLRFEFNNTKFQIDSLIATRQTLFMNEVKYFAGDYFYRDGLFYSFSGKERKDPLIQMERSASQLRQLLRSHGFHMNVEPHVVHVHPEFTLYQAPLEAPIIFPTQLSRYINNLNLISSRLNQKHEILAEKLLSLHVEEDPYAQLPPYTYEGLQKGHTCAICDSFAITVDGRNCICGDCGHVESVEAAVLRSVEELKLLFPELKITTNVVYDWCQVVDSRKRISRILGNHFRIVGSHQWAYYEYEPIGKGIHS
jgi:hypothetical protein